MTASAGNANPIDLTRADIDELRKEVVLFLQGQDKLKDYNFSGSNLAVILDILAHNQFENFWYDNMSIREMHPSSAVLRSSLYSHAKSKGYLPQSRTSSRAVVSFVIRNGDVRSEVGIVSLPAFTEFRGSTEQGGQSHVFVTDVPITASRNAEGDFEFNDVWLYEGTPVQEIFDVTNAEKGRFALSNGNADVSSLRVRVRETKGSSVSLPWQRFLTAADASKTTRGYFMSINRDAKYELQFGDGNISSPLLNGNQIEVSYRATQGENGNGIDRFNLIDVPELDGVFVEGFSEESVYVVADAASSGGTEMEEKDSVREHIVAGRLPQNRMVNDPDYRELLTGRFPFLRDVHVFGGEKATPPRFGKTIVVLDPYIGSSVSDGEKRDIVEFCSEKSAPHARVEIMDAEVIYVDLMLNVQYVVGEAQSADLIKSDVLAKVLSFAKSSIDGFGKTFHLSSLTTILTNSDDMPYVAGIDGEIALSRVWSHLSVGGSLHFDNAIDNTRKDSTVFSSPFEYRGRGQCYYADDGKGVLNVSFTGISGAQEILARRVGTVDYSSGIVSLNRLDPASAARNESIRLYATPTGEAISASQNRVLRYREARVNPTPADGR